MKIAGIKSHLFPLKISLLLIIALSVMTISCDSSDKNAQKAQQSSRVSGPIIDMNMKGSVMDKLDLNNQSAESLALLGDRYFEGGNYVQAIEAYKKALEKDPKDVDTHNDLGLALLYTGQPAEAIDILKKGTEVGPTYQNIWLSLGFAYIQTENIIEAKPVLQKTVQMNPNSAQGQEAIRVLQTLN